MTNTPTPAEVVAELQMVALAIRLFGLDQLPEVMRPAAPETLSDDTRKEAA